MVLRDLVTGVKCSTIDTIDNAVSDIKFEDSQQVVDMAVDRSRGRGTNEFIYSALYHILHV